ncbi:MAG: hypothetical protein IJX62_03270, partial [Clostridia bacterium]|nr:hypothetical protein [Clostridia bacterium]
MKTKRLMLTVLALVLMACCACVFASCQIADDKKEHTEHTYVSSVTAPTCSEKGYTTYTCEECGDSYVDNYVDTVAHNLEQVPAKAPTCSESGYDAYEKCTNCDHSTYVELPATDHEYHTNVLQYPTMDEAGKKEIVCSICGDSKETSIDALSVSLPKVADMLASVLGDAKYTLAATEGTHLIYIKDIEDETYEKGSQTFVALELAEVVLDGTAEAPAGHVKLEISTWVVESGAAVADGVVKGEDALEAAVYIYLDGNNVSVEVEPFQGEGYEGELDLDELLHSALSELFGIPEETMASMMFVGSELVEYLPVMIGLLEKAQNGVLGISPDYIAKIHLISSIIEKELLTSVKNGNNTVYTLNVEALKGFLALIEDDKTVADLIDDVYGDGTGDAIVSFIASIPDAKLSSIVDTAIEFTEAYGLDIDDTYYLINYIVYLATGSEEFNIENEILKNYDKTLVQILADEIVTLPEGVDKESYIFGVKNNFANIANAVKTVTVDGIYASMIGADPSAEGYVSLTETLAGMIDMLGQAYTLDFALDAEGNLISMNVTALDATLDYSVENGQTTIGVAVDNVELEMIATESGLSVDLLVDGRDYLDLIANSTSGTVDVDVIIRGDDYSYNEETGKLEWAGLSTVVTVNYDQNADGSTFVVEMDDMIFEIVASENSLTADYVVNGKDHIDFVATKDAESGSVNVQLVAREDQYDYDKNTGDKIYLGFLTVATVDASITVGDNGEIVIALATTDESGEEQVDIEITLGASHEVLDNGFASSTTVEVTGTAYGSDVDGLYEIVMNQDAQGNYEFSYRVIVEIDDEEFFNYSVEYAISGDTASYKLYAFANGEVVMDVMADAAIAVENDKMTLTVGYDISKLFLSTSIREGKLSDGTWYGYWINEFLQSA